MGILKTVFSLLKSRRVRRALVVILLNRRVRKLIFGLVLRRFGRR